MGGWSHTCPGSGSGRPILVVYMPLRGQRRDYVACSHCDMTDRWPLYDRVAHQTET